MSGILAQLGEHLPYKQRVTGSSPVGPIWYFIPLRGTEPITTKVLVTPSLLDGAVSNAPLGVVSC